MPLPTPNENESKQEFISRCMSDSIMNEEYPEKDKRSAVCYSQWSKDNKETSSKFSYKSIFGISENEDNDLIVEGYIATTHFDGQDIILKSTLDKWAKEINEGNPRSNKVSVNHNRIPHVAGVGIKGSARVDKLPDGEYGLYVKTLVDKTREDYIDIKYRYDNGLLDSFSIEYYPPVEEKFRGEARILDTTTTLCGWTLASQPMNEYAVMIKELFGDKMENQDSTKNKSGDSEDNENEVTDEQSNTTEDISNNENEKEKKENKNKEAYKMGDEVTMSKEQLEEYQTLKEKEQKAKEEAEFKEKMMSFLEDSEFKEKLQTLEGKQKVLANKEGEGDDGEGETVEQKENKKLVKEFKETIGNKDLHISTKFKEAGMIAEKAGLIWKEGRDGLNYKSSSERQPEDMGFKNFRTNGTKLEFKGLGITSNQNTDSDYLLSSAELRDMFDPVIYDALNLSTTTWGLLRKEDFSNKGNNQVQFVLKTGQNSARGFYTGNAVTTGNGTRLKMQTKFKKYQVGISVDGDMIAAAQGGPIGDVFGQEVEHATEDMISDLNEALFDENGSESGAQPIGFEYITDSAGNTTLYNLTRSTSNKLSPDSASDTYIDGGSARVKLTNLAAAIEQATKEGANINNLIFVTHPTQERLFKDIFRNAQQLVPTSSRFGFEGRPEFDGVPIFSDKDCNSDDWFLVDLESHKVAIWMPPTLEMLGKRSDAEEGFIKTYYAVYNTAPRRMVQIYDNATS